MLDSFTDILHTGHGLVWNSSFLLLAGILRRKQVFLMERSFYKIALSSDRGLQIANLIEKGKKAAEAADRLAEELGAKSRTDRPGRLFPGVGIGSLVFRKWPGEAYASIGKKEYIPNMKSKEGIEIARQIGRLPDVSGIDVCAAFGISADKETAPEWFTYGEAVYLSSSYSLNDEYEPIPEPEYRRAKDERNGRL